MGFLFRTKTISLAARVILFCAMFAVVASLSARAEDYFWTGNSGTDWANSGNWETGSAGSGTNNGTYPGDNSNSGSDTATISSGSPSLAAALTVTAITVGSGATLDIGADLTVTTITVDVGATLDIGAALTVFGALTNAGTVTVDSASFGGDVENSAGTLTVTNGATLSASSSHVITGNSSDAAKTKFGTLTCDGAGGKTLTIKGNVTAGTISISGTSTSSMLTVESTAAADTIVLTNANTTAEFITVGSGTYGPAVSGATITLSSSKCNTATGSLPSGWHFEEYIWTGTTGTAWATPSNWDNNAVPYTALDVVTINASTNNPIYSSGTSATLKSVTLSSGASLTVSAAGNIKLAGTLSNGGTIYYSSTGRITNTSDAFINDVAKGTVCYNGNLSTVTDYATGTTSADYDYYNLTLSGTGAASSPGKTIVVRNDFSAAVPVDDFVTIRVNGNASFADTVSTVTTLTVNGNASFANTVSSTGTVSVTGTTAINTSSITTTGTQTYTGAVTLGADTTLTAYNGIVQTVKFGSTVDGAHNLSFSNGTAVVFNGNVGSTTPLLNVTTVGTVQFNGGFKQDTSKTFTVSSGSITVGTAQFIAGAISLAASTTFTQTGVNTGTQSAASLTLAASTTTMEWDSSNLGGTLSVGGTISNANNGTLNFHNKTVSFTANATIENIVLRDLIVPSGITLTLTNSIRVRRDVEIVSGGKYVHNNETLVLGNDTLSDSESGCIYDLNATNCDLGTVVVKQGSTTKTFGANNTNNQSANAKNASCTITSLTIADGTGSVSINNSTVKTVSNTGGTFQLGFNTLATGSRATTTSAFSTKITTASFATTGIVAIGTIAGDSMTVTNGIDLSTPSSVVTAGTITCTAGGITISKPITLVAGTKTTMDTSAGSKTIVISGAISGATAAFLSPLTVNAGTSTVSLAAVGTSSLFVGALISEGTGTVTFNNPVYASSVDAKGPAVVNGDTITTTGAQQYESSTTIGADVVKFIANTNPSTGATASLVTFGGILGSGSATGKVVQIGSSASIKTNVLFGGVVGGASNAVTSLTVYGQTTFGSATGITVTTTGTQLYSGAVTLAKNASITSSSETITFGSTIDGASSLTTNSPATKGTYFNDAVGGTTPLASLSVTGPANIVGASVKTSGIQTYAGVVSVQNAATTITAGDGASSVTLNGNVTQTKDGSLTINASVILNANISFSASMAYSNISFMKPINAAASGADSLTVAAGTGTVIFSGSLGGTTPLGAVAVAATTIITKDSITTKNAPVSMDGALVLNKTTGIVISTGSGAVQFSKTVNGTSSEVDPLTVTTTDNVLFSDNVGNTVPLGTTNISGAAITITKLFYTASDAALTINNTGFLSIADITSASDTAVFDILALGGFSQTGTGAVSITGDIQTKNKPISFTGPVTLTGSVQLSTQNASGAGEITFGTEAPVSGSYALILNSGTGNITCNAAVGGTTKVASLSVISGALSFMNVLGVTNALTVKASGATVFGGAVATAAATTVGSASLVGTSFTVYGKFTSAGAVTITNSGIFLTAEDADMTLSSGKFIQNGTGTSQLAGGISTASGSGNTISFAKDVYLFGSSGTMSLGGGDEITCSENMYVSASSDSKTITLASSLTAKNIVLFGGTISLGANVTATQDVVLLNGASTSMYKDTATGILKLYGYNDASPARSGTASPSVASFPTKCPDETTLIPDGTTSSYCGVIAAASLAGKTITAGQNFYDNGVSLDGASSWTLKIKGNDLATDAFAELYNAKISYCSVAPTVSGKTAYLAAAENCTDGSNNTNVAFSRPLLYAAGTYTVYDDVVRVEFHDSLTGTATKIENSNDEIKSALLAIKFNNGNTAFTGSYTDASCATSTTNAGDLSVFYLKTSSTDEQRWNTDATGMDKGNDQSTDRGRTGVAAAHRTIVPDIDIAKATATLFQTLRDEHKNRIRNYTGTTTDTTGNENVRFGGVSDHCAPVLVAVYTGQELHTEYDGTKGASSQPTYDAHNFIEFQYSEAVDIGDISSASGAENVRASSSFASATEHGGAITDNTPGITVTGYATIASGELTAGERTLSGSTYTGSPSNTIHSLYRKFRTTASASDSAQTHRIRISVAGYVSDTVTANGNTYNNWNGYITSSTTPSGDVTRISNNFILDKAANTLDSSSTNHSLPTLTVNSLDTLVGASGDTATTLYGSWDSSRPEFALCFMKSSASVSASDQIWSRGTDLYANADSSSQFEIIGTTATTTSSYLDRIEFHLFDNTPKYDYVADAFNWVSKTGWYEGKDATAATEYAYDINGGSRALSNKDDENRTIGGIRRSSLDKATSAFSYVSSVSPTAKAFSSSDILQTTKSPFFQYTTDPLNATDAHQNDSLYFALYLNEADTDLSLTTTFTVSFDDTNCFITDLAGNLIQNTGSKKMASIDRVVPSFSLDVAAVGKNKVYMVFSKKLSTAIQNDFTVLSNALEFITMTSTPSSDSATVIGDLSFTGEWKQVYENASVTCVVFTLNRAITLSDIKNTWIRVKKPASTKEDPVTGVLAYVTDIQDTFGNYMPYYTCHALSDFAVNAVIPTYAKDSTPNLSDETTGFTTLHTAQKFDGNGNNDNRLVTGTDIQLQVNIAEARDANNAVATVTDNKAKIYFDSSVTGSRADLYNKRTAAGSDIWLPMALPSFNTTANTPENPSGLEQTSADATDTSLRYYTIHNKNDGSESDSFGWTGGATVQFLFSLTDSTGADITIDNDGDGNASTAPIKLYALRLGNADDITSFDLWQMGMVSKKLQRGGVTILNNVINPTKGEETVIQVDADEGNLIVAVMTLDGNIVQYLEHNKVSAGTHYYRWNGTNGSGANVARGLYFIRVIGENIDETRKVMIVK